jgi:hypothetical protein
MESACYRAGAYALLFLAKLELHLTHEPSIIILSIKSKRVFMDAVFKR